MAERYAILAEHPDMGRTGARFCSPKNYFIFYQPIPDGIVVLRFLHGARDIEEIAVDKD